MSGLKGSLCFKKISFKKYSDRNEITFCSSYRTFFDIFGRHFYNVLPVSIESCDCKENSDKQNVQEFPNRPYLVQGFMSEFPKWDRSWDRKLYYYANEVEDEVRMALDTPSASQ